MFNEATRKELISIIAEGVALGLKSRELMIAPAAVKDLKKASEPSQPETIDEDDDFAEIEEGPTAEEVKAQKKSAAGKKAAATRKKKADDKKALEASEAKAKEDADAMEIDEEEDELDDELDDGEDAEMIEVPAMSREDFMNTLKREATKHPNGEKEGRKLASSVLKKNFEVQKFGELDDEHFEPMCKALKSAIKSI